MRRLYALAAVAAGCAHAPPLPKVDPCLGLTNPAKAPRREYPEPEWVVGVGHSTGAYAQEQADLSARTAAAAAIAAQLLVRIRSDFTSDESVSSSGGGSYEARQKLSSTVDDVALPGLVQVATCFDPESLRTTALAAWHRSRGAASMQRLVTESHREAAAGASRLEGLLSNGRIVEAARELPSVAALQRRLDNQKAMVTALGADAGDDQSTRRLSELVAAVDEQRLLAVVRKGRASGPAFSVLAAEASGLAAQQGWKVVDEARALARLELSVESCHEQQVRALGAVRVSCPVTFGLSDANGGATSSSGQVTLQGAAATADLAVAVAVKQGLRAFEVALADALTPKGGRDPD